MTEAQRRALDLESLVLLAGNHAETEAKFCVMEAVAYVAGEPHSDHPKCASKVLGAFLRKWNDDLDDAGRQRLKPLIPRLVGTAGTAAQESQRSWMVTDWLVRVHTPAWLRLARLEDQALALEALAPILSAKAAKAGQPTINVARDRSAAARAAARDAAGVATGAAAWVATGAAAWDATGAAAGVTAGAAAGVAAWAAARAAAWDAAGAAAGAAAWDALKPTVTKLQASALDLVERLIAVTGKA